MAGIEIHDLIKRYGPLTAVDDISFSAADGELTTLLGPSGCGKTTTLRCIAGLERPDSGSISIGDEVVTNLDEGVFVPPAKRDIGFVFQTFDVWPHMNVFENVAYPLRAKGVEKREIRERVEEVLEMANIEALSDKDATDLSGGQQARVGLCRAIVSGTRVLLCDEPLTGLDRSLREQMRKEIRRIQTELGITTIYVTHSQPEAMEISDEIILMNPDGKIAERGAPEDIYFEPKSEYAFEFLGNSATLPGEITDGDDIQTAIGPLSVAEDLSRFTDGEQVSIRFRPQDLKLSTTKPEGGPANLWRAQITRKQFLGDTFELTLDIDGVSLSATVNVNQMPENIDEATYVSLHPDRVRVFPSHEAK